MSLAHRLKQFSSFSLKGCILIGSQNFVGIILKCNLDLLFCVRLKHYTTHKFFMQIHHIDKQMHLSPHFWQWTINFMAATFWCIFRKVTAVIMVMWSHSAFQLKNVVICEVQCTQLLVGVKNLHEKLCVEMFCLCAKFPIFRLKFSIKVYWILPAKFFEVFW